MKISLERGQKIFFTSDTHYSHANICSATTSWTEGEGYTRKFDSLEEMNSTLVSNINEVVKENDILFHLGDWSFGGFDKIAEFRNRINCKNIHLILGNHDHHIERNKEDIRSLFSSVNRYLELQVKYNVGTPIYGMVNLVLMHYPIASWNKMNEGWIHLHGHVHLPSDKRIGQGRVMDVGVEGNNLKPVSLNDVIRLEERPIKNLCLPKDHHEQEIK